VRRRACLPRGESEDTEAVRTVFRAFHTIKGTSAFLGFDLVSEFAHRPRLAQPNPRREIRYGGGYADLALRSIDMLKDLLKSVEGYAPGRPLRKPDSYDQLLAVLADPRRPLQQWYGGGSGARRPAQACAAGSGDGPTTPVAAKPPAGEAPRQAPPMRPPNP